MDPHAARSLLLSRAGNPDIGKIDGVVGAAQEPFHDLRKPPFLC
jgi:hypothetical protein